MTSQHGREIRNIVTLLLSRFADDVGDVERLAGGVFSRAYAFTSGGREYVVRVNSAVHGAEGFAKDDYAARHFASPALPIPRVLMIGTTADERAWFAISERVGGRTLQECSPDEARAALPALLEAVDSIGRADVSASHRYGDWGDDGEGKFASWHAYLSAIMRDEPEGYFRNWHALFQNSFLEREVYEAVYRYMLWLAEHCPEERALIHNDLWLDASNLLVEDGQVAGVIDWANALYGDPLYEVARIVWGTGWPGWWENADVARLRDRYSSVPGFDLRIACYQCHIGLDDLRYLAKNGRRPDYEIARDRLLDLISQQHDGAGAVPAPM